MISNFVAAMISVFIVSMISLIGVFTLSMKEKTLKELIIYTVSFAAGAMLGDAFLHLLPEYVKEFGFGVPAAVAVLTGIVCFYSLEKILHWQHCHEPITKTSHVHPVGWMSLIGDGLHNLLDGIIIGASFLISIPVGIATTVAVILHEIPQEIGDFSILLHAGFSRLKALALNFISGLVALVGVLIAFSGANFDKYLIPLTIGGFIYIAGSDLIPESHKHCHCAHHHIIAFISGIAIMGLFLLIG